MNRGERSWSLRTLIKVSVLGVISFLIMFTKTPVWFAPPFLKFDVSDLPSLLAAFAMGPGAGAGVQLVKNLLNIAIEGTTTGGVGELTNFLVGSIFACVAGYFYHKNKTFKNALLGLGVGIVAMVTFATVNNYYIMFPLYAKVFGLSLDTLVGMGSKVNKYVVDYKTLMVYAIVPFNLMKGIATSVATILVYKRMSPLLHR